MKSIIDTFLRQHAVAIVGASEKKDNFGLSLMNELSGLGYRVYPVNPSCKEINGTTCYSSVRDLPSEVENALILVPPEIALSIADELEASKIKRIWLHRGAGKGSYTEESLNHFKKTSLELVYGFCPMMFYGKGFHKFHFWFRKTFGKVPVEFSA